MTVETMARATMTSARVKPRRELGRAGIFMAGAWDFRDLMYLHRRYSDFRQELFQGGHRPEKKSRQRMYLQCKTRIGISWGTLGGVSAGDLSMQTHCIL